MDLGVLGSLQIRFGGTEIELGAPKLRALLIALALDAGRVVSAERLIDDLWGEDAPTQAMVSLRSYVSNLRRVLPEPEGRSLLVTRGRGYSLDLEPSAVDAIRFETLAARGRELLAAGDPQAALDVLDEALALWRGPALLDVVDLAFARAPIARLEELRLAAVEDRVDALLALGRHHEVVAEAEAHVAAHPLRERARGQLMVALHRSGRSADALATHRAHREALADEQGLDPSARLDRLAEAILQRDPELDPPDAPMAAPRAPSAPSTPSAPSSPSVLVGRAAERSRLRAVLAGVAVGRGGVVLLSGDPGIGKTAVLRQLAADAQDAAVPVVWGTAHESQGAPAFWPWMQVVRAVAERVDDAELTRLTGGVASHVAHLAPELEGRTGHHTDLVAADPHAARFVLYDAVATFLERAADPAGLVVVLDDLHWADLASLELLAFVGARVRDHGILVAGSYRAADADRTDELDTSLAALTREDVLTTLTLPELSRDDVAEVVARVAGEERAAEMAVQVHRRAGGNPFFVRQLAQLLVESQGDRDLVPAGVRHVLLRRLQLVPPEVRETLDVASVLGQDVDARPVAVCRELPLATVLDHLDVAAQHGLVERTAGAVGWRFVHALIRDTIHDELPPSRVVRLHAAAAAALEQQQPPPVAAIAEHLWQAADLVDDDRPVRWLRAAAEESLAVYAYEEGERYLRRALHLQSHRPADGAQVELAVRLRLIQVLVGSHGWSAEPVAEIAGRARELAGSAGIGLELTPLWWPLWALYVTRGELEVAHELAQQLLTDASAGDVPAALVAGHVAVAYTELFRGAPLEEVLAHAAAASAAEVHASPEELALTPEHLSVSCRITVGLAHGLAGDHEPALAAVGDAIALAQELRAPFPEAYARMFGGFVAAALDQPVEAREATEEGLAICDRLGLPHLADLTVPTHAWACARLGDDPVVQAARIEAAIDAQLAIGHRHALGQWLLLLAEVRMLAQDAVGARDALAESHRAAAAIGEDVYGRQQARVAALLDQPAPTDAAAGA